LGYKARAKAESAGRAVVIERSEQSSGSSVLPRSVRRALDAMHAAMERDIGLPELAAAAGLSGRALQRQFKTFLGKTPHEALRDIRFDCARRQLLQGAPGTKVMDIALRCGFPHFGRFSIEYRSRYNETPSQTLKRQALFFNTVASRFELPAFRADRPSLTIGPIEADPDHKEVARTIADELATALTRAGVSVCGQQAATRYHLSSSIRDGSRQTRLILRLIDRETGRHLWAHRAEGPFDNATAFDEQLATRITAALQPTLRSAEIDRALRTPASQLTAQDLSLQAMPRVLSLDAEGNARALDLLNDAMERDPDNALAVALAAWAYGQRLVYHFTSDSQADRRRSAELAQKALGLHPDPILAIVGNALSLLNDDMAEQVVAKALAIDGSSAWAWSRSAWIDAYRGNDEAAIERFGIALELAPNDSLAFNNMFGIGIAHFTAGRYRESAHWQARALAEHPSSAWIHRTLCPAYVFDGAKDQARWSFAVLRDKYPQLTLSKVYGELLPLSRAYCDRVVEALHQGGLPS
jgi:AraC-like DNA-binding protein/Tfp pilus assembly protein PilF